MGAYPGLTERIDGAERRQVPDGRGVAARVRDVHQGRGAGAPVRRGGAREPGRVARRGSLMMAAGLADNSGDLDTMRPAAAEAVDRFRALGERWGLSGGMQIIGNIRMLDGDLDGAAARPRGRPLARMSLRGPSPPTGDGAETGPRKTATLKCADYPISLGHVFPWRCLGSCRSPADLHVPSAPDQKDCSST